MTQRDAHVQVVRGTPDDMELAALVAGLMAAASERARLAEARTTPSRRPGRTAGAPCGARASARARARTRGAGACAPEPGKRSDHRRVPASRVVRVTTTPTTPSAPAERAASPIDTIADAYIAQYADPRPARRHRHGHRRVTTTR